VRYHLRGIFCNASRNMSAVIARFLIVCVTLVVFAGVALGAGEYQRTKDGKTTVWNANPRPGDTAAWFGDRDSDGYATGVGTLTWYTASGSVYGRYYGNMVHGKFDGAVNLHLGGRTAHAVFIDGQRTSRWVAGRAPSRIPEQRGKPSGREPVVAKAETIPEPPATPKQRPTPSVEHLIAKKPAPTPSPAPVVTKAEKVTPLEKQPPSPPPAPVIAKTEKVTPLAKQPALTPPPEPVIAKAENVTPLTKLPEPSAAPSRSPSPPRTVGSAVTSGVAGVQHPITESPAEGPLPVVSPPAKRTVSKPAATKGTKTKVDDSLRALVGPPSSLRGNPATGGWSESEKPESASSPAANASLTKQQVLDLADAEARARGYDPAEFRRPRPEYNPARKTWSLFYDQKHADEMPEIGKYFTVTVDDNTKKASITPAQ
jgi:hypothetical protein